MIELLTTKQVAESLQLSERTVFSLSQSGKLKSIKIGGSVRYFQSDVVEFLLSARTEKGGETSEDAEPAN